jgi:hypothetical protein
VGLTNWGGGSSGSCTCVGGGIAGVLLVSKVVLGTPCLKRLLVALVVTGAIKFGTSTCTYLPGGSSKGFKF